MKKIYWRIIATTVASVAFSAAGNCYAELGDCAEQFPGGDVNNAPTLYGSAPAEPYGNNKHLCYRDDGASFFAVEYWPEQYAPRWAAYKLTGQNYGENGCDTVSRKDANCYYQENTWEDYKACSKGSDPFHADYQLSDPKLGANDFSNTGHDRGHIAPFQAFNWHICGAYQTFTMANMSPQRAFLNQDIWRYLEQQVLTWAIDDGPIYVVSGATYDTFPADKFRVFSVDRNLSKDQIYPKGLSFSDAVIKHHSNYTSYAKGEPLRPKRNANPEKTKSVIDDIDMPTGYFKVLYRPQTDDTEEQAIGFYMPHTFENLNLLTERYDSLKTEDVFWAFTSRIDLIEEISGLRFPGIPGSLKSNWGNSWFEQRAGTGRNVRSPSCVGGNPAGILENSTRSERLSACTDMLQ